MGLPGIVLLAHGSRGEKIEGKRLKEITGLLQSKLGNGCTLKPAFLQFNHPNLEETVASFFSQDIKDVVVLPYFLFEGSHYNQHIPEEIARLTNKYPGLNIHMARSLGVDERILDVVIDRFREVCTMPVPLHPNPSIETSPIEQKSFSLISLLYPELDKSPEGLVRKRVLHATADAEMALSLRFHSEAIASGVTAQRRGKPIITDVHMVEVGINRRLASQLGCQVLCAIREDQVISEASQKGITRAAAAMRFLLPRMEGAVIAIGNAPTALMEILDLIANGDSVPALIIGLPVGFVNAAEAKAQLVEQLKIPYIALPGMRGGSSLAVACINALLHLAADPGEGGPRASI